GNTAVALATNLALGNLYQVTVTFWFQLGPNFASGDLSRFVDFGALLSYDAGNKGSGNHNGIGTAENTPFYEFLQNGVAGSGPTANNLSVYTYTAVPAGLVNDGATWYF